MTGIHPATCTSPRLRPETPLYRSRDRRAWTNRNGRLRGLTARGTIKRTLGGTFDGQGSRNRSGVGSEEGRGWRLEECEGLEGAAVHHPARAGDGRPDESGRL